MSVLSSELRERVEIQQRVASNDGAGGQTVTWAPLATVFASVEAVSSSSPLQSLAGRPAMKAAYRIRIRHRTDLAASQRLLWKGYLLTIHTVWDRHEVMEILAYLEDV